MNYFEDLADYKYFARHYYRPIAKNIAWLDRGYQFNKAQPTEEFQRPRYFDES